MTNLTPPYMVVTDLDDGTGRYSIWFQNKDSLLQTIKCPHRQDAKDHAERWEKRTGTRAIWRKTGDV